MIRQNDAAEAFSDSCIERKPFLTRGRSCLFLTLAVTALVIGAPFFRNASFRNAGIWSLVGRNSVVDTASGGGPSWLSGALWGQNPVDRDAADPNAAARDAEESPKLLRIHVRGMITPDLVEKTKRDINTQLQRESSIEYVVFEIDTFGGDLVAAHDLSDFIFRKLESLITIAYVPPGSHALSAGALIAIAANDIIMGDNSFLGAAAPKLVHTLPDGQIVKIEDADEKTQSLTRQYFKTYASKRGYPSILTDAMVTKARSNIYWVTLMRNKGDVEVEERVFKTQADLDDLKHDHRVRVVGEREPPVLRQGELLTLGAEKAFDYGFAKHLAGSLDELLHAMNIVIPEENILGVGSAPRAASPGAQSLFNFLNHPFVRCLLLLGGCLGLLLEFKMLGTMIPAAIGFFCFAVFFGAALFPVTEVVSGAEIIYPASATGYEIMIFVVGIALIGLELFFPGLAIFAITGVTLCAVGIVLAMMPPGGENSQSGLESLQDALLVFFGSFSLGLVIFLGLLWYLPSIPGLRKRGLVTDAAIVGVPTAESSLDAQAQTREFLGMKGVATTSLRPAGKIALEDGRYLDVVSSGRFIEKGNPVRIIDTSGGRTVVTIDEE